MKLFIAALAALLACACGGGSSALTVVSFYGDSITTGTHFTDAGKEVWSPTPVQYIAQLAGITAHDYSRDGMGSDEATIASDDAQIVVIRFGVADAVHGMTPDVFASNITRLVGEARALGKRPLLTGLPHATWVDTAALDNTMRERAQALAVPFVDVHALVFDPTTDPADTLHPALGYSQRIGAAVAAAIRGMV
jgi:lysophospholipase L1-like esterase